MWGLGLRFRLGFAGLDSGIGDKVGAEVKLGSRTRVQNRSAELELRFKRGLSLAVKQGQG